jgi:thioredoxin 1
MNKSTGIVIGVIALVVIVGGVYASMNNKDDAMMEKEKMAKEKAMMEKKAMEEKDAMMKADATKTDSMMKKDDTSMMDKSDTMMKVGSYEAYSADKLARAETGDVVLFFHASWCPSCRGLNTSIESNLKSIPEGVTILKTDYDKETELKKKYGVTYQHTLVQVDKSGNMIKKWSGGGTLDNLLSQIQ